VRTVSATWAKLIVGLATVALVIGVGVRAVRDATTSDPVKHRVDFVQYVEAGRAVLAGTNIYEARNPRGMVYTALPVYAIAMVPFALLKVFWGSILWYALCVLMFGHTVRLSASLAREFCPECRLSEFWFRALVVLLVLLVAMPALSRLNPSILTTYLVTLCVWLYLRRRVWASAFCLAASIVVKVFPGLLLVYFLYQRKFRLVALTALWLVVFTLLVPSAVFGVRGNWALVTQWVHDYVIPMNASSATQAQSQFWQCFKPYGAGNQSVKAVFVRLMTHSPALAQRLSLAVNAGLLIVTAWVCRVQAVETDQPRALLQCCLMMPLMLFVSPLTWFHYFTLLLMPLAVVLATSLSARASFERTCSRLGLASYVGGLGLAMSSHTLYKFGILPCGTAGLWLALAACVRGGHTSPIHRE
jgi:hypothetical protein